MHDPHCAVSAVKPDGRPQSGASWRRLLLVGLLLNALLVVPAWWRDGAIGSVWLAPEAWLLPALLALWPGSVSGVARLVLAAVLAFVVVAGLFDGLVESVLSRPLNVFIDPLMLAAGFHLVKGSMGLLPALAASALVAAAAVGIVWSVDRLLALVAADARRRSAPALGVAAASLLLAVSTGGGRPIQSQVLYLADVQLELLAQTREQRQRLIRAEADAAFRARALTGLSGRDVYVVFVESYGVTAIDDERYAPVLRPGLSHWQSRLSASGLSAVSGRLEAPIRGGQSWLSHATLLSGLPVDNQLWYRTLLERDIDLLSEDFRRTGHTAINVVPAITRDWPEGRKLGFDRIYGARDLNYAGPSLGWVTMPDEFTLHALSEQIRPDIAGAVYAQVALISSHWPWQPILSLTEAPGAIGRGEIYARWAGRGRLSVIEQFDLDRLRRDYARSLAYSLDAAFDWARRQLPADALMIVLGDHQPVSLVTGRGASAAVPVHVVSGDPALLEKFRQRGFEPGLIPPDGPASHSLARLRHWMRADFAGP